MLVVFCPLFIVGIQVFQVFELDVELKVTIPFLNLLHEFGDVSFQIDQQVGRLDEVDHGMKKVQVTLVVAVIDVPTVVEVRGKDVRVLVNSTVLDNGFFIFAYLSNLVKATVQKIDLEMKCPASHVIVKIAEIGVVVYGFVERQPAVVLRKLFHQGSFTRTDVAGDGDVLDFAHLLLVRSQGLQSNILPFTKVRRK